MVGGQRRQFSRARNRIFRRWRGTRAAPAPWCWRVLARASPDSFGPNGFCTYAAQQPVDPTTGFSPYFIAWCGQRRTEYGIGPACLADRGPRDSCSRAAGRFPISAMFASRGYTWAQTLILCDSAFWQMPAGTACDYSNANDVYANYGGGTSFVAPAFAGIMALIDQKSGDRQGQANYVLYPLAGEQYVSYGSSSQPSWLIVPPTWAPERSAAATSTTSAPRPTPRLRPHSLPGTHPFPAPAPRPARESLPTAVQMPLPTMRTVMDTKSQLRKTAAR